MHSCLSCRVWGATWVHRTRHRQTCSCGRPDVRRTAWSCMTSDTHIHSRRRRHDKLVVQVPWFLPLAPSPPPSPFPPPWGFFSPSSSVLPPIARGAVTDVATMQNGAYRVVFVVPTPRFLAQVSKGVSSPPPPVAVGREAQGVNFLPILLALSNGAEEPCSRMQHRI